MAVVELSTKDRIIRAAEQLFAEQGFESTSMGEIRIHAGQKQYQCRTISLQRQDRSYSGSLENSIAIDDQYVSYLFDQTSEQ